MEISNDLMKNALLAVVAGVVGAGGGYGGANFKEAGHDMAVERLDEKVESLEREARNMELEFRYLRAQLNLYTTGAVDFSAGLVAPMMAPAFEYEMDESAAGVAAAPPE